MTNHNGPRSRAMLPAQICAPLLPACDSVVVPTQNLESYLAIGWRLADEPHCSGARMVPPNCAGGQIDGKRGFANWRALPR